MLLARKFLRDYLAIDGRLFQIAENLLAGTRRNVGPTGYLSPLIFVTTTGDTNAAIEWVIEVFMKRKEHLLMTQQSECVLARRSTFE